MNKNIIILVAIATFVALPAISMAQTPSTSPSVSAANPAVTASVSASNPAVTVSVSAANPVVVSSGSAALPATTVSGSQATPSTSPSASAANPATTVSNSAGTPATTNSGSAANTASGSNGGGSTGGSTGGGSTSNGGSGVNFYPGGGYSSGSGSCSLITTSMRFGADNNSAEVTKLQSFLKNNQGLNVEINGIFDSKTDAAVKAFQTKYADTIMAPWGMTQPSGYVYITTMKKINQLACNKPLTLNSTELSEINSYRNGVNSEDVNATVVSVQTENVSDTGAASSTTDASGQNIATENINVATVAQSSIIVRFWNFIVSLFR